MLEHWQKHDAFLQRINPTLKLASLLLVIFGMVLVFDPWTPLIIAVSTVCALKLLGGIPWKTIGLLILPFSFFALSFVWMSVLFPGERGQDVLFHLGPVPVAMENVITGTALGLRSLVFGLWSLLFVLTTEPTKLMLGLVQHCKLPPRFGYGIMAAYRMLPLFRQDLNQIRAAHRIRGLGEARGLRGRWEQIKRYAIPLLAGAVRKAERAAVAMESKGFDGSRERSFYRTIAWTRQDILFGMGLIILAAGLFGIRQLWV
ncbi:energy-coupling factor transporter transmembrane component T family protein [Paenibacillus eucommiae]|uniref:Energy-coupling factor transport system permease protein n=1 Tax=Paenibacillus eucommiae TaxID=1355755 RepID=A0ABS4IX84_9BACL|nr:energy-coupling factor transporter transmembrane component T [Paenibacillus eucommiae]MBP1992175.1 energy-coupling factor transport system permease protein [Paenibacillus eucommiae]